MIATWSDKGRACMLATKATNQDLQQLFATTTQLRNGLKAEQPEATGAVEGSNF
jgi:hypothetical protein